MAGNFQYDDLIAALRAMGSEEMIRAIAEAKGGNADYDTYIPSVTIHDTLVQLDSFIACLEDR
jgi:hypothetical protein